MRDTDYDALVRENEALREKASRLEEELHSATHQSHYQATEVAALLADSLTSFINEKAASVIGVLGLLERRGSDSTWQHYIDQAKSATLSMMTQHDKLTMLSRQLGTRSEIDLYTAVTQSNEHVPESLGGCIDLVVGFDEGAYTLKANDFEISELFQTILQNSYQAVDARHDEVEPHITVDATVYNAENHPVLTDGTYAEVIIGDNGVGMSSEKLSKAFLLESISEDNQGLGLILAYAVAQKHGGYITLESEEGVGTKAHIYLPLENHKITEETPQEYSAEGKKLLIAEDEERIRALYDKVFTKAGYEVLMAKDGQVAWNMYQEHADTIDAVCLDMIMPGMHGTEVLRNIRESGSEVPVVVITGYDPNEDVTASYGPNAVLSKPILFTDMLEAVENVITYGTHPAPE